MMTWTVELMPVQRWFFEPLEMLFCWWPYGQEVLPQDTMHLIQRPRYQWGSPCQNPAGKRTTQRPPDYCEETQTAVVWSCIPFIRSGQKPSCKARWKGKEDKADRWRGGKTTSGNGQAWSSPSPRGQWKTGKMEETGFKIICGSQRPSWLRNRWDEVTFTASWACKESFDCSQFG